MKYVIAIASGVAAILGAWGVYAYWYTVTAVLGAAAAAIAGAFCAGLVRKMIYLRRLANFTDGDWSMCFFTGVCAATVECYWGFTCWAWVAAGFAFPVGWWFLFVWMFTRNRWSRFFRAVGKAFHWLERGGKYVAVFMIFMLKVLIRGARGIVRLFYRPSAAPTDRTALPHADGQPAAALPEPEPKASEAVIDVDSTVVVKAEPAAAPPSEG